MKTHYYPFDFGIWDEEIERGPCGVWLGENSELTHQWEKVNCKRCLNKRNKIDHQTKCEEDAIVSQMGDMADYFKKTGKDNL